MVTDDDIIRDSQSVAYRLNKNSINEMLYYQNGGKYSKEVINEFGGFNSSCELAGLKIEK